MPTKRREQRKDINESLRYEYREVAAFTRQFHVVRFGILAFSLTLMSFLANIYGSVLGDGEKFGQLRQLGLSAIPLFGIITTLALLLMDWRLRNLSKYPCFDRGEEIERRLGLENGHIRRIRMAPAPLRIFSHTLIITLIYALVGLVWFGLSVYTPTERIPIGDKNGTEYFEYCRT